ncbi:hypothetical protein [Ruegeria hyattellae]|uniref:hypothetical protein n=1 Tax=Ruegeria hyattellae TaxID=3233337 RepID=UPI00355BC7C7
MKGYWDQPDETEKAIVEGWFDTGDEMSFDEDGYHWFAGRKKQIIVNDGSNVSPQDIEGSLLHTRPSRQPELLESTTLLTVRMCEPTLSSILMSQYRPQAT